MRTGMPTSMSMSTVVESSVRRPVVLCILDGWGYSETLKHNAVTMAQTPNFDYIYGRCSQLGQTAFLDACEKHVGLPDGQIGNSEVGHMNIGAGRVVYQVCMRLVYAVHTYAIHKYVCKKFSLSFRVLSLLLSK